MKINLNFQRVKLFCLETRKLVLIKESSYKNSNTKQIPLRTHL